MCATCGGVENWRDDRSHRTPGDDAMQLAELRQGMEELPSYGYLRARRALEGGLQSVPAEWSDRNGLSVQVRPKHTPSTPDAL